MQQSTNQHSSNNQSSGQSFKKKDFKQAFTTSYTIRINLQNPIILPTKFVESVESRMANAFHSVGFSNSFTDPRQRIRKKLTFSSES